MRQLAALAFAAALVSITTPALAQVPAGGERLVNTTTADVQLWSDAAALPSGGYVVVWTGRDAVNYLEIFGQRFAPSGAPVGGEFRVNTTTVWDQHDPAIAADRKGGFVVVWADSDTPAAPSTIAGRRFGPSGAPIGSEFRVDSGMAGSARPDVAIDPGGDVLIAWDGIGPGDSWGIFARRMLPNGTFLGGPFRVNTYTTDYQESPSVAGGEDGRFVVVWNSRYQDGDLWGIFGQRVDRQGALQGAEFQVNVTTALTQARPSVGADLAGNFVVVWDGSYQDGSEGGVAARRYLFDGTPATGEIAVNTFTTDDQLFPQVAVTDAGPFVVTWSSDGQDGSYWGAFAQRFDAAGARRGGEFRVNTQTASSQAPESITADPAGNFVVTWQAGDGSYLGVFAQRFGGLRPTLLVVDAAGNGVLEAGEATTLAPAWRNSNGATQTFGGVLDAFTAPPGVPVSVTDGTASYGTVPNGANTLCIDCYGIAVGVPPARPVHLDTTAVERITPDAQGQIKIWSVHVGESFSDVAPTSPYYRFVETILHHGVTGGCTATAFCPEDVVTRAEAAVFVIAAKEVRGYVPPPCATPLFADVPASSPFCPWIEELARRGVVGGCGGGNYCPSASVSREQMAVVVLRTLDPTLNPPACVPPNLFADVPETSPFCRWIEELANRSIVTGCGGGNYCPTAAVTREQMGVFISATFALTLYGP